jgi:hypothetical protein
MKATLTCLASALFLLVALSAVAVTRYVDLNNPSPTPPYTNWASAATTIQDAIDAAAAGDLVLVTNGIYQTGGRVVGTSLLTNRVAVTKAITVQSVNGRNFTTVRGHVPPPPGTGDTAVRCAYLTNGAAVIGFTLTGGATRSNTDGSPEGIAGGVWCVSTNASVSNCVINECIAAYGGGGVYSGTLTDCTISTNSVLGGRGWGGGAWNSSLIHCTLVGNSAYSYGGGAYICSLSRCQLLFNLAGWNGGGAYEGTANNSLIVGNSAQTGGGSYNTILSNCTVVSNTASVSGGGCSSFVGAMQNCIFYYNTAPLSPNLSAKNNYCCTMPLVFSEASSFTNAPLFVDPGSGDFRLQTNSPCINAGGDAYVIGGVDLTGDSRIAGGAVDVGAYELQSPASQISYAWLQKYGLPLDGTADSTDLDGDGMSNWGEWRSDTIPTNALSALKMVGVTNSPTGAKVTWQSVSTRLYFLKRATNLGVASPFQTIATNLPGVTGTKIYTDTGATNAGPYFYRVGVQ